MYKLTKSQTIGLSNMSLRPNEYVIRIEDAGSSHNMNALGCKHILDNLIINVKYGYVLGFTVLGPPPPNQA